MMYFERPFSLTRLVVSYCVAFHNSYLHFAGEIGLCILHISIEAYA